MNNQTGPAYLIRTFAQCAETEIYTPAYKESLLNAFPDIFKNHSIIDRLITGNYTEETDIHKRPLAKFVMDISIDVGLISREGTSS